MNLHAASLPRESVPTRALTASYHWVGVEQAGEAFHQRLQAHGVQADVLSFNSLTGGYGGPHCSSQVLRRAAPGHPGLIIREVIRKGPCQ